MNIAEDRKTECLKHSKTLIIIEYIGKMLLINKIHLSRLVDLNDWRVLGASFKMREAFPQYG